MSREVQDADPLEQDELHTTNAMLPGCFHFLMSCRHCMRVCDLIMTAIKRNGTSYRGHDSEASSQSKLGSPGAKKSLKGKETKLSFFCVSLLRFI